MTVLFIVLLFIGFWRLPYSPATWYDEGLNAGIARSFVEDGVYSLKVGPDEFVEQRQFLLTTNYPVLLPVAASLKIFGINFFAARLPMVIYLFLFVGAAYYLALGWYGSNSALATLALLVVFLPIYGNGKAVLGEVPGLFFLLLGLVFLDKKNIWPLFLSGLMLGLAIATKPFFLLLVPALFAGEIYYLLKKGWRKPLAYLALFIGIVIPVLFWFRTINPDLSVNNISSIFSYYSNSYADQTDISGLAFSNLKRFVTESTPIHFALMFSVSLVMIFFSVWKKRARRAEVILMALVALNFLWYLKTPGWYRYFFPAHLLLFIFFPAVLFKYLSKKLALSIVLLFFVAQSYMLIAKRDEPLYFSSEVQDFVHKVYKSTVPDKPILVVNSPAAAFLLSDRNISQYVRINPELVFSPKDIQEVKSIDSPYIVTGSLLEEDGGIKDLLDMSYEKVETIAHHTLYKRLE